MPEEVMNRDHSNVSTQASPLAWRELDVIAAEAELRLRLPQVETSLENLEKAKVVTQQTLQYKFSI